MYKSQLNQHMQDVKEEIERKEPNKKKAQKQPKSLNKNIQSVKLVGSYGNHFSLLAFDHYGRSILNKSNPTNLNMVDQVGTNNCRARSRAFNVRSHL